jgi:F0F1-type ATP synthase gamma subunit
MLNAHCLLLLLLLLLLLFAPAESFSLGATPTTREAQAIADEVFADFVSAEVDKVELVFTKFVSLINSTPTIQVGFWMQALPV